MEKQTQNKKVNVITTKDKERLLRLVLDEASFKALSKKQINEAFEVNMSNILLNINEEDF
jgi:hypothetical protein